MKTSLFRRLHKPLFLLGVLSLGPLASYGQSRSWTTATPTGDSGNWSDTTRWLGGNVPDSAGESAVFGGYANDRTVTVDTSSYVIDALTIIPRTTGFAARNFTLNTSGGGSLQLGSGGLTVGNGGTTTLNVPIQLTANQIWTTNSDTAAGSVVVNGILSGNFSLTRNAQFSQAITFTGANTFSGGFVNNSANTLTRIGGNEVITSGTITSGALGIGTITLNAGSLSSNGGTARTVSNNVVLSGGPVTLGNSGQTGALTFSDVGLTAASTFTLGSANNSNVSTVRVGGTNLIFDQVIAESGGIGQSVNFASTSGTPTVTLNRTKTATGNILVGGVNLVLANGAANSGSLIGVNGSITATGANKFSSGSLYSDGTSLIATDATNYSAIAGGQAAVYNNGRVSFATDQTQATVAGLITSDSQVRLGLGAGAASSTVTESYNQAAIGNGKAGLVSASTGTVTYNGTLSAGSDNTIRVGGGLGTLALGTALTGSGSALSVEGGGTVTTTSNNTYTGATSLNGTTLTLSGNSGALSSTSGVTINNAATLNLTNNTGAVNADRIGNSAGITLNNGLLALNGTSTAATGETLGDLTINSGGRNFITVAQTPGAATVKTLQFGTLTRNAGTVAVFRGDTLGTTATARNEIKFSATPTLVGGGGAAGTTNISVLPWARGGTTAGGNVTGLVTYEANGIRQLVAGEYVNASNTNTIDVAIGANTDRNVSVTSAVTTGASTVNGANSTVNALLISNTGATGAQTFNLGSSTVSVTSGAIHVQQSVGQNLTIGSGTLAFGGAEGVITTNNSGFLTTIGTQVTGTSGLTLSNLNGGGLSVSAITTAGFTGDFTIGGNGFVGVDQDQRFGNSANNVVHGGGSLQFFAGFTSTRGLMLLGNVGNNTLANNTTSSTVTWNGDISGAGLLRLVNNASTTGPGGFTLGGNNTYTGGTQIEGINVTATTNNALGTGVVTLVGANNNAANLTLAGTGATLGGLRGTDGTVTINPTGSSATLTVGSSNENTIFNGVIAQGAGKTGSLTKTGTGTLVLGGDSSYTGTTTVNGGVLNLNGRSASTAFSVTNTGTLLVNSLVTTGPVTVATGATLGGSGTVTSAVTIQSGGTLSPGNSPGLPSYSNLTLETSSNFKFELVADSTAGRGTNFDGVNILAAGSLTIQSGVTSSLVFNGTGSSVDWSDTLWASDQTWLVFDLADNNYAGSVFSVTSVSNDALGQSLGSVRSGASFSYSVVGGDIYLNYTAVPEPATLAMVGLGVIWLCGSRRRRSTPQG